MSSMENGKRKPENDLSGPPVSVIIPVYNTEKFLPQCIESVISQRYRNMEIILIDDGSTDGSGSICDAWGLRDPRIKVFHKANGGLSSARNFGLDRAQGDWIAFVDSDDRISENMIGTMLAAAQWNAAGICECGFFEEDKNHTMPECFVQKEQRFSETLKYESLFSGFLGHVTWNKLYKKELFGSIRFPEGRNYEDGITTLRILQSADAIVCIPDILYYHRSVKDSITNIHSLKNESDRWLSCKEIYDLSDPRYHPNAVSLCIIALWRTWLCFQSSSSGEKYRYRDRIRDMHAYVLEHTAEVLRDKYSFREKVKMMLMNTDNCILHKLFFFLASFLYKYRTRNYY